MRAILLFVMFLQPLPHSYCGKKRKKKKSCVIKTVLTTLFDKLQEKVALPKQLYFPHKKKRSKKKEKKSLKAKKIDEAKA